MKIINKFILRLDNLQRRWWPLAFAIAVIKKFGEDQAGSQAALLTYYAFLSLFPLMLILITVTDNIAGSHSTLHASVIKGLTNYFPVLGNQLAGHVHSLHSSGLALVIGILFALYGTRGVADAFRRGVRHIWGVPRDQNEGFPKAQLRSVALIVVGGAGFLLASVSGGLASAAGHELGFRLLSVLINFIILFLLFTFLLNACLPRHVTLKETRAGALAAAIGLVILQSLGGYLVAHELRRLDALYSYFALALGIVFWIYLQAQMLFYAVEIAAVSAQKNWPRSLSGHNLTPADHRIRGTHQTEV